MLNITGSSIKLDVKLVKSSRTITDSLVSRGAVEEIMECIVEWDE